MKLVATYHFSRESHHITAVEALTTDAATAVDRERGNVDQCSNPTGYGETLAGIALKIRDEAFAPVGRDLEMQSTHARRRHPLPLLALLLLSMLAGCTNSGIFGPAFDSDHRPRPRPSMTTVKATALRVRGEVQGLRGRD